MDNSKGKPRPPVDSASLPALTVDDMTSRDFQRDINAHYDVAKDRLKDHAFLSIFQQAISMNRHLFRGRIVLDVNCGMGILSLFAAKAGAKHVYAVDPSNVSDYTRRIVDANGYSGVITVLKSVVQEVELPVKKVDVIISNWVGYSLLFQSSCDAVIFARDKWLKNRGVILPDIAKLFVATMENKRFKNEHIEWWNDVYGFNMNCIRQVALAEPSFEELHPKQVLSTEFCVKTLDMHTATYDDLAIRSKFMVEMQTSGRIDGIVTYFSVFFSKTHMPLYVRTDPEAPPTQWLQSAFFFDQQFYSQTGQTLYGGFALKSTAPKGKLDLNLMELAVEIFSGERSELQLEAEMRWTLKPHSSPPEDIDDGCVDAAKTKTVKADVNQNNA